MGSTIEQPVAYTPRDRHESAPASQTLSRGIRILEFLADAREPVMIEDLARALSVHRSIAYRLLRTLEQHRLVERDAAGCVTIGARMAALATGVAHDLQAAALPELTTAANDLGMTSFLTVLDQDECITVASVEPRHAVASVVQRPGARHSVLVGAPGKALLSILGATELPTGINDQLKAEIEQVRRRGYATSHDEVIPTVQAVAVPLGLRSQKPASIAAIHVAADVDIPAAAARLIEARDLIVQALGGR